MNVQEMVLEFHQVYGGPIGLQPSIEVPRELIDLRIRLINEEFTELKDALAANDLIEVADGLADLAYVVFGAAITFGIDLDRVVAEVHRSNLSKLGEDGKPIIRDDGKVLKGPNFFAPDIASTLTRRE